MSEIGISFDFFNTLVEIDSDVPTISQELSSRGYPCNSEIEAIWNSHGFDGQVTNNPKIIDYNTWRGQSLGLLCELCGVQKERIETLVPELIDLDRKWTVKARSNIKNLISNLRDRSMSFCVLSNWDYPIEPYLEMAGLPTELKTITSAELGVRKPHPATFKAARDLLNITPDRHIHIGDSWNADVVGALRSGAWAIWVSNTEVDTLPNRIRKSDIDFVDQTLNELLKQLKEC